MDIVSRKAILRDLLAEYRAHKEEAEREADRVRARIAEEVPVYADLSGAPPPLPLPRLQGHRLCGLARARILRLHQGRAHAPALRRGQHRGRDV